MLVFLQLMLLGAPKDMEFVAHCCRKVVFIHVKSRCTTAQLSMQQYLKIAHQRLARSQVFITTMREYRMHGW